MRIKNRNIVLWVLLLVFCFPLVSLFADAKDKIFIEEQPSLSSGNESGYDVYNYRLENLTSNKQIIDIRVYIDNESHSDLEVTKQVELVGKESRNEKVFFPVMYSGYTGEVRFYLNGSIIETFKLKQKYSYNNRHVLLDKSITANDADKLFKDPGLDWSERGNYTLNYFESNLDMMDKDWIAYYQYVALIFYDHTFKEMPPAVREAIMEYVKAGGKLIILGEIDSPTDFWGGRTEIIKNSSSGVKSISFIGMGKLLKCDKDLFNQIKKTPQSSSSYGYSSYSRKEDKKSEVKEITYGKYIPKDIMREFNLQKSRNLNDLKVESCFNDEYKAMTSVSLLIVLVFFFALLLGPVNFYFLNLYNKRILIFVSVPLIAIICCSIIFIYFLLFEYGRLDVYRQSFVMLDENTNTSVVLGGELIISGKAMNEPLSFPINSIIGINRGRYGRGSASLVKGMRLDKAQNLTYNWIKAKEPFAFSVISVKQDRSRVEFNKSGSDFEILNGLGADISIIYYREDSERVYQGSNIKAGSKATITKSSNRYRMNSSAIDLYSVFKNYNKQTDSADSLIRDLRPGEYIAVLKKDPFLKQDIDRKANIREMGCFVYGKSKKGVSR